MRAGRRYDVIVVGLGPVGATLAALLARQGLHVLALDQNTEVYPLPRAAHIDQEALRILQQVDAAAAVLQSGRASPAYEFRSAGGEVLMHIPPRLHPGEQGWPPSVMFHQPALERAVRAALEREPTARIQLGCRLVELEQDDESVVAKLETGGAPSTVEAQWLLGCDGASSRVRGWCGVGLFDYGFDEPWLVLDVVLGQGSALPAENLQICDPRRPTTCLHMGAGRHRFEFMLRDGETAHQALDDAFVARLLAPWRLGDGASIERKAVYRFHGLVADRWRHGRVFLAGDAAHQTPPFAGQGMCAGLKDAANLAWKLAAVTRGEAAPELLDTYQVEREPLVRALIELAIFMGRIVCTTDEASAAERDRSMLEQRALGKRPANLPAPVLTAGVVCTNTAAAGELFPQWLACGAEGSLRLDDVLGRGAWLLTASPLETPDPGLTHYDLGAPELQPYRPQLSAWLQGHSADAVLVRPDRYVFGAGPAEALQQAWRASTRRAR